MPAPWGAFIMIHGNDPDEWASLTAKERVSRCRLWGAEARQFALNAGAGRSRELLLSVATAWDKLAEEIEREEQSATKP